MSSPLRVAIIGASGIGRHHANWHHALGSQVVAFVGTSAERCQQTATALNTVFGFHGNSYVDLDEMLRQEAPDVVDVCSPNAAHIEGVRRALESGCHVLCEKPLVWDDRLSASDMLEQARHLSRTAASRGRTLGMCSQLAAIMPQYRRFCPMVAPNPESLFVEMETLSRGRLRTHYDLWVDMGPHPLSLILAVYPEARIEARTLRVESGPREVRATFAAVGGSQRLECDIVVRDCDVAPPVRRFGFDGHIVHMAGRAGDDGYYRSVLSHADSEDVDADPMHLLIGQFTRVVRGADAAPLVTAETALGNLEMQLQIAAAV